MQVNNHLMNGQILLCIQNYIVGMLIANGIIYKKNFI